MNKRAWTLVFAWSVFWTLAALGPLCEGWAAIEAPAGHATHLATPVQDVHEHVPTNGEAPCCHSVSEAATADSKPNAYQIANTVAPIAPVTWSPLAALSARAAAFRIGTAPQFRGPVFLNTHRLRI